MSEIAPTFKSQIFLDYKQFSFYMENPFSVKKQKTIIILKRSRPSHCDLAGQVLFYTLVLSFNAQLQKLLIVPGPQNTFFSFHQHHSLTVVLHPLWRLSFLLCLKYEISFSSLPFAPLKLIFPKCAQSKTILLAKGFHKLRENTKHSVAQHVPSEKHVIHFITNYKKTNQIPSL